jgi:D-sedoheptulose 7-phosphate isomerase
MSDLAEASGGAERVSATGLKEIAHDGATLNGAGEPSFNGAGESAFNGLDEATIQRHRSALQAHLNSLKSAHCAQVDNYIGRLQTALATLPRDRLVEAGQALLRAYRNNKQVFTIGNGGSSSTASHMAADLAKNTIGPNMKRFRIMSLADNGSIMTALANDLDYESVFSEQLVNVICAGDVLIAISGGGNSPNILKAIRYARLQSAEIVGLLGFDGGEAAQLVDIPITVHSGDYGIIEDVHLAINHMLVEYFKEHLAEARPWLG